MPRHVLVPALLAAAWCVVGSSSFAAQRSSADADGRTVPLAPVAPLGRGTSMKPAHTTTPVEQDVEALSGLFQGGGRYRITVGDVIQIVFPYVPEFEQTVSVQPDGYISLRAVGDLQARGLTVADLKLALVRAYEPILNQPVVSVVLKDFEKPYVVVAGQIAHPGKYELRGAMTLTQAIAIAGGNAGAGKLSDVLLFRRFADDRVDVKRIDVKRMYAKRNLSEDPILRPGDTVFVPKSSWAMLQRFIPTPGLGVFANPTVK